MSVRALKTFLAVARNGTFVAAAKEIGITQAGVSMQMKSLERELKAKLFDRIGRTVVLNTSGRALISTASEVVRLYDNLDLSLNTEDLAGSVRIGAVPSTFESVLPGVLGRLKKLYPRVKVQVFAGISSDLTPKVENGELDAALVLEPPGPLSKSLNLHHVSQVPVVLIAPKSMRIASARDTLTKEPFIRLTRAGWAGRAIDKFLHHHNVQVQGTMELDTPNVIMRMVAQGLGISIIPMFDESWQHNKRLQIWRLSKPLLGVDLNFMERRAHSRGPLTAALLTCLRQDRRSAKPLRIGTLRI